MGNKVAYAPYSLVFIKWHYKLKVVPTYGSSQSEEFLNRRKFSKHKFLKINRDNLYHIK